MKYFTRGWASGELTDTEVDAAALAYKQRLTSILPTLPEALRRLTKLSLHDAIIERVRWSPEARRLCLRLVTGTWESGCLSVELTYNGAMLGERGIEAVRNAARDREACVLYDEIDVDPQDGTYCHRLLFWPREEVTLDFGDMELTVSPRSDRRVCLAGAFVEETDSEE